MSQILLCYVERRGGDWEAVCFDYDIAVQGHSWQEVQERLTRAIYEHVEYAKSLPEPDRSRLLSRRVPLRTRFMFVMRTLAGALFPNHGGGNGNERASFTYPCAA